jgi:two-component system chemotaxis response regulator CheY
MQREVKTLVVDDCRSVVSTMETMLGKFGIGKVSTAGDGLQALDLFASALQSGAPYSLVFLDIVMPRMDGQQALKQMRTMESDAGLTDDGRAVIIMATALHSAKYVMDAFFEGDCSDYLVKPFAAEDLYGMLRRHDYGREQ